MAKNKLCSHGADLLAVAERRDRDRAIPHCKLRSFQKRQTGNTLARSNSKCVDNQRIVFISANFYLAGIALAVVSELGFHAAFPDKRVKMSRSSNINLIVCDNRVELLLGFAQSGNVVKNDFRFLVLLRTFSDTNLDCVNDRKWNLSRS